MAGMKETNGPPPLLAQSQLIASSSSPAPSDVSVSTLLDKDGTSIGCSPAPSNCSLTSEQEPLDTGTASRQSPFLPISQASPSSSFGGIPPFVRPDYLNTSIPDSETSSRSSLDGICLSTSKSSFRSRRRKNSSDSSGSEGSGMTMGGESIDGDDVTSSRKNSKNKLSDDPVIPVNAGAPRGRIANIRRESNCSVDNEAAHERLVKASQQVSNGFDDIAIERSPSASSSDHRRRTPSVSSVGEPITIVTNSFLPHSCSPSPTRAPENNKARQCYSPSTQQMVRPNIPYSPSPSPTQSPTRHRLLRSLSPIATRTALKRRYTASGAGEDSMMMMGGDGVKRCVVRNSTSPLVTDRSFPYPAPSTTPSNEFAQPQLISLSPNLSCSFSLSLRRPTATHALFEGISRRSSVESNEPMEEKTYSERSCGSVGAGESGSASGSEQGTSQSMDVDEPAIDVIDRSLTSVSEESNDVILSITGGQMEARATSTHEASSSSVVSVADGMETTESVADILSEQEGAMPPGDTTPVFYGPSTPIQVVTVSSVASTTASSSSESFPSDLAEIERAAFEAPLPDSGDDNDDL